jgi:CheY-like chemotaxis protein
MDVMDPRKLVSEILLVEDVGETVEGLELDLRQRGAAVVRVATVVEAVDALRKDPWDLILFDLRLPVESGEEPTIAAGIDLIRDKAAGKLGKLCEGTRFAVISLQNVVGELDEVREFPGYIGMFSKADDSRRLFRSLRSHGVLGESFLDEGGGDTYRQRVKFICHGLDPAGRYLRLTLPSWRDGETRIGGDAVRRSVRDRARHGPVPFFVYGSANVSALTPYELEPSDLNEMVDIPEPYGLNG